MRRATLALVAVIVAAGHQSVLLHGSDAHATFSVRDHCKHCDAIVTNAGRPRMGRRVDRHHVLLDRTRSRVYRLIAESSGLTKTELARAMGVQNSSVAWHLDKLLDAGLISRVAGSRTPIYRQAPRLATPMAEAAMLLESLPARELVELVCTQPGLHLAQLAAATGAPRSRYWRVVVGLQKAGLLRVVTLARKHLLYPTDLAREALRRTHPPAKVRSRRKTA